MSDWVIARGGSAPSYIPSLRKLAMDQEAEFLLARACYYDAVGHDDGTVHLHRVLSAGPALVPNYDLVIVDEVQDLNGAEVALVDLLSGASSVVIAGDDDQALYGDLRDASEDHIRALYKRDDYLQKNLPFCMRCSVAERMDAPLEKADALSILAEDQHSNLGWRVAIEVDKPQGYEEWVRKSVETGNALHEMIDPAFGTSVLEEVQHWSPPVVEAEEPMALDPTKPSIRLTTFEGAKGMSAQHVFILGLNHKANVRAIDVRRMIVALTRARKQSYLLRAKMAFGKKGPAFFKPSIFIQMDK